MKERFHITLYFLRALPRLPGQAWRDRDQLSMVLFGRPFGRKARAEYAAYLDELERWRKDLYR